MLEQLLVTVNLLEDHQLRIVSTLAQEMLQFTLLHLVLLYILVSLVLESNTRQVLLLRYLGPSLCCILKLLIAVIVFE